MSGHSQFANIKHRKDAQDHKRGKIFQKIAREIYVAVKLGGSNLESNPRLKVTLEKARKINMPKDNINRAINKASNKNETTNYEAITYEGYLPPQIAIIVHCLTDNKNRTASNIRSYFNKFNGHLAVSHAVQYLFHKKGVLEFTSTLTTDDVLELIFEFEIFNINKIDNMMHIEVHEKQLAAITAILENNGIQTFNLNEISNIAHQLITVDNLEQRQKITNLLTIIADDDDVLTVEHNFQK